MSASFLVIGSNFPSGSQPNNGGGNGGGNTWTDCGSCVCMDLNYDAQTCCLVILPSAAAATFFVWLFFQKGHLAVGLVLAQLLAIVLLGVLTFLLATALRRCWRRLRNLLRPPNGKQGTGGGGGDEAGNGRPLNDEQMPQQVHV